MVKCFRWPVENTSPGARLPSSAGEKGGDLGDVLEDVTPRVGRHEVDFVGRGELVGQESEASTQGADQRQVQLEDVADRDHGTPLHFVCPPKRVEHVEVLGPTQQHRTVQTRQREALGHQMEPGVDDVLPGISPNLLAEPVRVRGCVLPQGRELPLNCFRARVGHDVEVAVADRLQRFASSRAEDDAAPLVVVAVEHLEQRLPELIGQLRLHRLQDAPRGRVHPQVRIHRGGGDDVAVEVPAVGLRITAHLADDLAVHPLHLFEGETSETGQVLEVAGGVRLAFFFSIREGAVEVGHTYVSMSCHELSLGVLAPRD